MGQALSVIAPIQSALGGGMSGGGAIGGAFADRSQSNYEASVLKNNAKMAELNAQAATRAGAIAEQEKSIETAQTISNQRTALAGRGVVVGRDTADVIAADATRIGTLDKAQIKENALRQAFAYRLQGYAFKTEAKMKKQHAQAEFMSGLFTGGSTLLNSATSVAAKWKSFNANSTDSGSGYMGAGLSANPAQLGY